MKFLYGTYGFDLLSIFLIFISMFLNIGRYTRILGAFLIIIVIYRAFSKNVYKRTKESKKFTSIANKMLGRFGKKLPDYHRTSLESYAKAFRNLMNTFKNYRKSKNQYKNQYKIVKCPKCRQKLRLPRGKGYIIATCKKCNYEFKLKT
ncbi:hypothetical protein [Clostridium uliginosum]|uniref:Zn-finger containing protein n=1 Tax=Clostridium uliginosum TaxID=119641 RepID=A0A1I1QD68_9CLOT|nr:hypothetical protein [Clostridium uliginosum]SFD17163.1 hypothetical protein SAMN05421842_12333 [Clostridium uliginosum]